MLLAQALFKNCTRFFLAVIFVIVSLQISAQPLINSFSPKAGPVGSSVIISGNNFSVNAANNIVYLGAVRAVVTAASSTSLTVTVPFGATYQPITVTTGGLTAYTNIPFNVTFSWSNTINNLLANKIDFSTGLRPNDLVLSDLDGDGKADVATANNFNINNAPASISVLRNTGSSGNISFAQNIDFPVGAMAYAINAGDLNGDGKPDLVASSIVNKTISVLRNTSSLGNISFATKLEYTTDDNPYSIAIADFNKDGKPDIAVANYLSNTISVFKNTSNGSSISFAAKIDFNTALAPYRLITADLDGDGSFDLAVTNSLSNSVSILKNTSSTGSISFAAKIDYVSGKQPQGISCGDIDADGKSDLLVANYADGTVSVFKNNSTGSNISFAVNSPISFPGNNVQSVSAGDLNGDGKPEVVVPGVDKNSRLNYTYVVQNTSITEAISFGTILKYYSLSPYVAALGDLDNDGKTDIAEVNFSHSSISVFRNRLTDPVITSFSPTTGINDTKDTIIGSNFIAVNKVAFGGISAKSFTVLNADTIIAIVGSGKSGKVSVTTSNGTGALNGFIFAGPPSISSFTPSTGTSGSTITIAGSNLIGATDVSIGGIPATSFLVVNADTIEASVGAGASGSIYVQTAYGASTANGFTFIPPPQINSFTPMSGPVGTTITIIGSNFSNIKDSNDIYFGSIKGTVLLGTNNIVKVTVPKAADYDPFALYTGPSHFPVYSNLPFKITFPSTGIIFTDHSLSKKIKINSGFSNGAFSSRGDIVTADFDGDGKNDMAVIGVKNYGYKLSIFKNTGSIDSVAFANVVDYSQSSLPERMAICDIDNDGKQDILLANQGGYFIVFKNASTLGNISFTPYSFHSYGPIFGIAARDLDGDGKAEVVVTSPGNNVEVHRNTSLHGNITFSDPVLISVDASFESRVLIADLNGDGKSEIILSSGAQNVVVFKNQCSVGTISFDEGTGYPAGYRPSGLSVGDIDGDNKLDIVASDFAGTTIYVLKNTSVAGNISFNTFPLNYAQQMSPVYLSDFNGDGKPDILAESSKGIFLIKNNSNSGSVSFSSEVPYASVQVSTIGAGEISASDIDGDGKPDVIEVKIDSISVFKNQTGEPKVVSAGAHPVTGSVITKVTIDPTVQVFNGSPYVQRHYDIEPNSNASTATAFVTLYFTQQDFDNFNAYPEHGLNLPTGPSDLNGIANIRIYQYHGFSATSEPGSYSGSSVIINPADSDIIWNADAQYWEVSFNVEGFSGFFLSSASNNTLPLQLISFTGSVTRSTCILRWITSNEENLSHFVLERSADNKIFETIKTIQALNNKTQATYQYNDTVSNEGTYYYRLIITGMDGMSSHSKIITIKINTGIATIKIIPNPAKDFIIVRHPASIETYELQITDATGRTVKRLSTESNSQSTEINVSDLPAGLYHIKWLNEKNSQSKSFIIAK